MPRRSIPIEERFWPRVVEATDLSPAGWVGCWIYTGAHDGHGYARIRLGGKHEPRIGVHRFAYEYVVGKIPEGLVIDHKCRRPLCVNPAHMEPVTRVENVMRGESIWAQNARKTHCPRGHEYAGANLHVYKGLRVCKACKREKARERRLQQLA